MSAGRAASQRAAAIPIGRAPGQVRAGQVRPLRSMCYASGGRRFGTIPSCSRRPSPHPHNPHRCRQVGQGFLSQPTLGSPMPGPPMPGPPMQSQRHRSCRGGRASVTNSATPLPVGARRLGAYGRPPLSENLHCPPSKNLHCPPGYRSRHRQRHPRHPRRRRAARLLHLRRHPRLHPRLHRLLRLRPTCRGTLVMVTERLGWRCSSATTRRGRD